MVNIEKFVANDITNNNRKPKDTRLNSFRVRFTEAMAIDDMNLRYVAPSKFDNMTEIEEKLRKYIKDEGMKLMVSNYGGSEMFVNTASGYSVIVLTTEDVHQTADYRICSLAHEIGHYMDYKHNFDYNSDLFEKFSEEVSDEIISELVAWAYAKDMLLVLGYNNWEYFNELAVYSLASYTYGQEHIARELVMNSMDKVKEKRSLMRDHVQYWQH